jgi:hypothetical protein
MPYLTADVDPKPTYSGEVFEYNHAYEVILDNGQEVSGVHELISGTTLDLFVKYYKLNEETGEYKLLADINGNPIAPINAGKYRIYADYVELNKLCEEMEKANQDLEQKMEEWIELN